MSINSCWLYGHKERYPEIETYEEPYCAKCGVLYPQPDTLPDKLNQLYTWLVDRHWRWFDALDEWLGRRFPNKMPWWWSY